MKARIPAIAFLLVLPRSALAQDNKGPEYDESALKAALEEAPGTRKKTEKAGTALEVPPPPPRKSGVVVESSIGAMVFGEGDLSFTSTRYSPPARGYVIYAFGGGGRLTVGLSDRVGVYGQVDFGLTSTSSNVLHSYGFYDAENNNAYYGATGGLEWYQIDPHYGLALFGGVRNTQGFVRQVSGDVGLAWRAGAAIRYAF
jgi:hypothetical protein